MADFQYNLNVPPGYKLVSSSTGQTLVQTLQSNDQSELQIFDTEADLIASAAPTISGVAYAQDTLTIYGWDGSAWVQITGAEGLTAEFASPLPLGSTTPNTVAATTLTASSTITATGKIGYASGGTVTQATSRSTTVTLNKLSGTITTVAAVLNAGVTDTFTLTNSTLATNDLVIMQPFVGTTPYHWLYAVGAVCGTGTAEVTIKNSTAANSSSEAIVIKFIVIKAPIA